MFNVNYIISLMAELYCLPHCWCKSVCICTCQSSLNYFCHKFKCIWKYRYMCKIRVDPNTNNDMSSNKQNKHCTLFKIYMLCIIHMQLYVILLSHPTSPMDVNSDTNHVTHLCLVCSPRPSTVLCVYYQ